MIIYLIKATSFQRPGGAHWNSPPGLYHWTRLYKAGPRPQILYDMNTQFVYNIYLFMFRAYIEA